MADSYQKITKYDSPKEKSIKSRMGIGAENEKKWITLRRKRLPYQES